MKCLCRRKSTEVDRGQKENLLIIFWLKYRLGGKFGNEIKGQGRQRGIWATFQPSLSTRMHNQRSSFCIIFLGSLYTRKLLHNVMQREGKTLILFYFFLSVTRIGGQFLAYHTF